MLEIKMHKYLHPPLPCGGFKRRTERCDRHCREILLELKLIQGLNHSKDGRVTIIVLNNRNKSLKEKKKSCIISGFVFTSLEIYSGRDVRVKKRVSKRRYYLQQVLCR